MGLEIWDKVKTVPADAQNPILGGRLKGKTDISPVWRYQVLTELFGVCGVGWKYEITDTKTFTVSHDQIMVQVFINFYIYQDNKWSEPIPAVGGDFLVTKESSGLHSNDEAFKMALTDALGVACKMLGVGADIYMGKASAQSKYQKPSAEKPADWDRKSRVAQLAWNDQFKTKYPVKEQ